MTKKIEQDRLSAAYWHDRGMNYIRGLTGINLKVNKCFNGLLARSAYLSHHPSYFYLSLGT